MVAKMFSLPQNKTFWFKIHWSTKYLQMYQMKYKSCNDNQCNFKKISKLVDVSILYACKSSKLVMQCAIYKQMKVWTLFSSLCCSSSLCPAPGPRRTPAATSWGPCPGRWGSAPPTRTAASSWLRRTTFKERVPQFRHWSLSRAAISEAPFLHELTFGQKWVVSRYILLDTVH